MSSCNTLIIQSVYLFVHMHTIGSQFQLSSILCIYKLKCEFTAMWLLLNATLKKTLPKIQQRGSSAFSGSRGELIDRSISTSHAWSAMHFYPALDRLYSLKPASQAVRCHHGSQDIQGHY